MAEPVSGFEGAFIFDLESGGYGVDPTPTADDAYPVDPEKAIFELDPGKGERKALRESSMPLPDKFGIKCWKVAIETEFKNGGTAGTPSKCGRLVQCGGFLETDNGTTDDTYTPLRSDGKSGTGWHYWGGQLFKGNGIRFSKWSFGGKSGEPLMAKFEGMGLWNAVTDSAVISTPVLDLVDPIIVGDGSFSFGGIAMEIEEINVEVETEMRARKGFATTGYHGFTLGAFKSCAIKIKAKLETVADMPVFAGILAGTNYVLDATYGTTAGNKIDHDHPRCRLVSAPKLSVSGGIAMVELEARAYDSTDNAKNNWMTLKFY